MQLFSGSLVGMREREGIRSQRRRHLRRLININHPNNKRLYFVKRDIELIEDKMVVPNPQNEFDEDFKKKILAVVKYCDYLDYSDEPDYDALIDGLVKNMDD
jgi:hypothetical protein